MLFHFADDIHLCQLVDPVIFFILEGFQEGDDVVTIRPARIEIELYCFLAIDGYWFVVMDVNLDTIQLAVCPIAYQEIKDILSVSLIRDAANKGNSNGELWLGLCYHYASGVDQDFEEAFRWFSRSAQKGNKLAMGCVGQAYDSGQGVEQDQAMAIKYYQQGAENGDAVSQAALGLHYLMGQGIEQDWTKGFVLLKLAADQGHTDAMQWLPYCYFNGWGTEKNNQEAINVLTRLKEEQFDDDEDAQQNIDDMIATINRGDTLSAYEFQFRILPIRLLQGYANFALDEDELIDLTQLRLELGSMFISHYECDLDSLFISTHQVDDSTTVHVIHMPEPSRPPLCKYAAYVMDKKNGLSRYYTLEKTYNLFGESGVDDPYEMMMKSMRHRRAVIIPMASPTTITAGLRESRPKRTLYGPSCTCLKTSDEN